MIFVSILLLSDCVFLHAENKKKADMIEILRKAGYPSDPVKAWKESISTPEERSNEREEEGEEGREGTQGDAAEKVVKGQPDYNYLLGMQLWSLTKEKKDEMIQNRDKKVCVVCVCVVLSIMWYVIVWVFTHLIVWLVISYELKISTTFSFVWSKHTS